MAITNTDISWVDAHPRATRLIVLALFVLLIEGVIPTDEDVHSVYNYLIGSEAST